MAQDKSSVDILFKEHSFEEIESVRDSLASEIDKRTELLKTIVKEKYKDVVETSDGIQSLKLNLARVEESISRLDGTISNFHHLIKEPKTIQTPCRTEPESSNLELRKLYQLSSDIWDHFDSGDLKTAIKLYNDVMILLDKCQDMHDSNPFFTDIKLNMERTHEIIKSNIWYRIQSVKPNQIGVIANCDDDEELYRLSLQSSIEFLVEELRKRLSDVSLQAQVRRYQEWSYLNTETNTIDTEVNDMKPPNSGYLLIPKTISPELSDFLYNVCLVINTIAGFSLTRSSILESLRLSMLKIVDVYTDVLPSVMELGGGSRTKRSLQLYFDLKYVRVVLNSSKSLNLINELDLKISSLMSRFEDMLDRVELYVISDAMHTNALNLSRATIRLYGLLIPYLQ